MKKVISCGLSPNLRLIDVYVALRSLADFHEYQIGDALNFSSLHLKRIFKLPNIFLFMRARDGEYLLLKSLGIGKGDEVIVQAFTCAAVIQPILWAGAKPIYVDISEDTLSMNFEALLQKINSKTKMIILQSTFGLDVELAKVRRVAKDNNIFLLLDFAHVFNPSQMRKVIADGYLLSFGRDKAVSSVTGGALVIRDVMLSKDIENEYSQLQFPTPQEIVRYLIQPVITYIIKLLFVIHPLVGKAMTRMYRTSRIVPKPVGDDMTLVGMAIQKYPNALAKLLLVQLNSIDVMNKQRIEWTQLYKKSNFLSVPYKRHIPLLRVPYRTASKEKLIEFCKKDIVYLGDWYSHIIDPGIIPHTSLQYKKRSCPTAEKVAREIVNLPVNPTLSKKDILRVIRLIRKYEAGI